jgi:hypothetical protein
MAKPIYYGQFLKNTPTTADYSWLQENSKEVMK